MQSKDIYYQSQIDSINKTQHFLQIKVDSLSKIINETKIGHDFFSDVISTNLYMFTTIIGIVALISWGWLKLNLFQHKRSIKVQLKETTDSIKKSADIETQLIWKKLNRTHFDVNRLGYTSYQKQDSATLFLWVTSTAGSLYEYRPDMIDDMIYWSDKALELIKQVKPGEIDFSRSGDRLDHYIKIIASIDHDRIQEIWKDTITLLNHLKYNVSNKSFHPTDI